MERGKESWSSGDEDFQDQSSLAAWRRGNSIPKGHDFRQIPEVTLMREKAPASGDRNSRNTAVQKRRDPPQKRGTRGDELKVARCQPFTDITNLSANRNACTTAGDVSRSTVVGCSGLLRVGKRKKCKKASRSVSGRGIQNKKERSDPPWRGDAVNAMSTCHQSAINYSTLSEPDGMFESSSEDETIIVKKKTKSIIASMLPAEEQQSAGNFPPINVGYRSPAYNWEDFPVTPSFTMDIDRTPDVLVIKGEVALPVPKNYDSPDLFAEYEDLDATPDHLVIKGQVVLPVSSNPDNFDSPDIFAEYEFSTGSINIQSKKDSPPEQREIENNPEQINRGHRNAPVKIAGETSSEYPLQKLVDAFTNDTDLLAEALSHVLLIELSEDLSDLSDLILVVERLLIVIDVETEFYHMKDYYTAFSPETRNLYTSYGVIMDSLRNFTRKVSLEKVNKLVTLRTLLIDNSFPEAMSSTQAVDYYNWIGSSINQLIEDWNVIRTASLHEFRCLRRLFQLEVVELEKQARAIFLENGAEALRDIKNPPENHVLSGQNEDNFSVDDDADSSDEYRSVISDEDSDWSEENYESSEEDLHDDGITESKVMENGDTKLQRIDDLPDVTLSSSGVDAVFKIPKKKNTNERPDRKSLLPEQKADKFEAEEKKVKQLMKKVKRVNGVFKCPLCKYTNKTEPSNIRRHLRGTHFNIKFQCDQCSKRCYSRSALEAHKRIPGVHTKWGKKYVIFEDAEKEDILKHHMKSCKKNTSGKFQCPWIDCKYEAKANYTIKTHVRNVHLGVKRFQCPICGQKFCDGKSVNSHLMSPNIQAIHEKKKNDIKTKEQKQVDGIVEEVKKNENGKWTCPKCEIEIIDRRHLKRHILEVHYGIKKAFIPAAYGCTDCNSVFPNKQSLAIHYLLRHPSGDEIGLPHEIINLRNSHIVVTEAEEANYLIDNFFRKEDVLSCCNYTFFTRQALFLHLVHHHMERARYQDERAYNALKTLGNMEDKALHKIFTEVYEPSKANFQVRDNNRKVYILVFVPEYVTVETFLEYISDPNNDYWIYIGQCSVGRRNHFFSHHHIYEMGKLKVCTNYFAYGKQTRVFHVADFWISEGSTGGLERLQKLEAEMILKLLLFSNHHGQDRFFQKPELPPLQGIGLSKLQKMLEDIISTNNFFNLPEIGIQFVREINILSSHVTEKEFNDTHRCKKCNRVFFSKHHLKIHKIKECEKGNISTTDKLLIARPTNINEIYRIIKSFQTDNKFIVYGAIGLKQNSTREVATKERLRNLIRSRRNIDGYVGISSDGKLSKYHERLGFSSSIKKMIDKKLHVYQIVEYVFDTYREAERAELAIIVVGFIRKYMTLDHGIRLVNKMVALYKMYNLLSPEDVTKILKFAYDDSKELFLDVLEGILPEPIFQFKEVVIQSPKQSGK